MRHAIYTLSLVRAQNQLFAPLSYSIYLRFCGTAKPAQYTKRILRINRSFLSPFIHSLHHARASFTQIFQSLMRHYLFCFMVISGRTTSPYSHLCSYCAAEDAIEQEYARRDTIVLEVPMRSKKNHPLSRWS